MLSIARIAMVCSLPCSQVAEVLQLGQGVVDRSQDRCLKAKSSTQCAATMGGVCARERCSCERTNSRCLPDGCSPTLADIAAASVARHPKCVTDLACNAKLGAGVCIAGRCRCADSWGMWNCSYFNGRQNVSSNHLYKETIYATYYTNLSLIQQQSLSSEVMSKRERGVGLSGPGSTAEETQGVRTALPVLINTFGIRSIIDVPCGDFNYMRAVLRSEALRAGVAYTGLDIVSSLINVLRTSYSDPKSHAPHNLSFGRFDLSTQYLWPADLLIVRDILFHFDMKRVLEVLDRIDESGCRYALITYFPTHKASASNAKFRAGRGFSSYASWNLEDEPFRLPPPLLAIGRDGGSSDRVMGLWRCPLRPRQAGGPVARGW
jgi:hypothetical protein